MAKGWKSVSHRDGIIQRLESIYMGDRKRPRNQKFNAWFDDLLDELVEHDEKLREYGAFLEAQTIEDSYVLLMDNLKKKHVFVNINSKGKALHCEEDAATDCMHVGFCLALPKVYKALLDKGFRPPIITIDKQKEVENLFLDYMKVFKGNQLHLTFRDLKKVKRDWFTMKNIALYQQLLSKYDSGVKEETSKTLTDKLKIIYALYHPEAVPEVVQGAPESEDILTKFNNDVEDLKKIIAAKEKELQLQKKPVEQQLEEEAEN